MKRTFKTVILTTSILSLMACSCGKKTQNTVTDIIKYEQISPEFNADSAYNFVKKQVDFGTRVPNSPGHIACGDFLISKLKSYGAKVTEQKADLKAFDGTILKSRNIIGSYGESKNNRVLLFAHWDTRPFADQDELEENHNKPILGANDGGSGVGILLEIARNIHAKKPNVDIDIIFFDSEDYGPPAFNPNQEGDWWCLGSQYWGKNPHEKDYKARYGILLDMVGAKDAKFHQESISKMLAPDIQEKVWSTARKLGYGDFFVGKQGGAITDDHLYVNQLRRIPSIDIIQFNEHSETGFYEHWHTQKDDMDAISSETLKAVGQTVMEVIYKEEKLK